MVEVRFPAGARDFSLLHSVRDWFWASPSVQTNRYQGLIPWGVKLTTHLPLVQRTKMVELYLYSPICLHGIALN
jgi:hypothetical protein